MWNPQQALSVERFAQAGVGGVGTMERSEVKPGWREESDEATHLTFSLSFDDVERVWLPMLRCHGLDATLHLDAA